MISDIYFIDIESTGVDPATDRIVELAIFCDRDPLYVLRFNPQRPISHQATEVHGIKDADVADAPIFADWAERIHRCIKDAKVICGFGVSGFDIPLLWEELYRAGITWDLTGVTVIDAGIIFKRKEERTLSAAVAFYLKRTHEDAHGADADVRATIEVLGAQIKRYELDDAKLIEMSKYEGEEKIDLAGKFIRNKDGDAVYNFGKQKGIKVADDTGLAVWLLGKDFSENTKIAARKILDEITKGGAF